MEEGPGEPFLMDIEDVLRRNQGRVVMLTGRIGRGRVRKGDEVAIVGFGGGAIVTVGDIEACRRYIDEASTGMNVGLLMRGVAAGAVERGQVLAAPGSISEHTRFAADIALLSEEHGAAEVRTGDRLQFHIRTAVVTGDVTLTRETDVLHPLHRGDVTITLERPVALEDGQSFAFRHLGRAAGSGVVTLVLG
ncbi:EF-Tu/IF-2/RF-3 family GTPase [Streptomyces sp. NPDC091215]|uniref:EF-Tu C-terminal domain-related protein n=1 Tax=Streptomyces sp. NPDC091215 TaxID=3155192 RepID=UPI00342A6225